MCATADATDEHILYFGPARHRIESLSSNVKLPKLRRTPPGCGERRPNVSTVGELLSLSASLHGTL